MKDELYLASGENLRTEEPNERIESFHAHDVELYFEPDSALVFRIEATAGGSEGAVETFYVETEVDANVTNFKKLPRIISMRLDEYPFRFDKGTEYNRDRVGVLETGRGSLPGDDRHVAGARFESSDSPSIVEVPTVEAGFRVFNYVRKNHDRSVVVSRERPPASRKASADVQIVVREEAGEPSFSSAFEQADADGPAAGHPDGVPSEPAPESPRKPTESQGAQSQPDEKRSESEGRTGNVAGGEPEGTGRTDEETAPSSGPPERSEPKEPRSDSDAGRRRDDEPGSDPVGGAENQTEPSPTDDGSGEESATDSAGDESEPVEEHERSRTGNATPERGETGPTSDEPVSNEPATDEREPDPFAGPDSDGADAELPANRHSEAEWTGDAADGTRTDSPDGEATSGDEQTARSEAADEEPTSPASEGRGSTGGAEPLVPADARLRVYDGPTGELKYDSHGDAAGENASVREYYHEDLDLLYRPEAGVVVCYFNAQENAPQQVMGVYEAPGMSGGRLLKGFKESVERWLVDEAGWDVLESVGGKQTTYNELLDADVLEPNLSAEERRQILRGGSIYFGTRNRYDAIQLFQYVYGQTDGNASIAICGNGRIEAVDDVDAVIQPGITDAPVEPVAESKVRLDYARFREGVEAFRRQLTALRDDVTGRFAGRNRQRALAAALNTEAAAERDLLVSYGDPNRRATEELAFTATVLFLAAAVAGVGYLAWSGLAGGAFSTLGGQSTVSFLGSSLVEPYLGELSVSLSQSILVGVAVGIVLVGAGVAAGRLIPVASSLKRLLRGAPGGSVSTAALGDAETDPGSLLAELHEYHASVPEDHWDGPSDFPSIVEERVFEQVEGVKLQLRSKSEAESRRTKRFGVGVVLGTSLGGLFALVLYALLTNFSAYAGTLLGVGEAVISAAPVLLLVGIASGVSYRRWTSRGDRSEESGSADEPGRDGDGTDRGEAANGAADRDGVENGADGPGEPGGARNTSGSNAAPTGDASQTGSRTATSGAVPEGAAQQARRTTDTGPGGGTDANRTAGSAGKAQTERAENPDQTANADADDARGGYLKVAVVAAVAGGLLFAAAALEAGPQWATQLRLAIGGAALLFLALVGYVVSVFG